MTDPIIRSKRFRSLVCLALGILWGMPAWAANLPKVPVVHQVGVVPVQLEAGSDSYDLQQIQDKLDQVFPKVVRDAKRFRVLNDDLVRGLWNTPEGRGELRGQFELQGYLSLTAVPRADTVTLGCRLLGPDLQTYLLETELYQHSWLMSAPPEAVRMKLEELVFRVINRIPIDVSVTSVQGPYITLSGGETQGIEAGDRVTLVRASIKSLHPANGSWVDFQSEPLGEAKIIEVKTHSSVAKLVQLTFEGALEVGDGAKIPAIAGRVKFARMAQKEQFKDSGDQDTILVPPLYQGDPPVQNPKAPAVTIQPVPDSKHPADESYADSPSAQPTDPSPIEDDSGSVWDDFSFEGGSNKLVNDLQIAVGAHWWNTKGRAGVPANGKFPIWLVNNVEVSVTRAMFHKIRVGFGGGGTFGSTEKGSHMGYDSHAKIYWREDIAPGEFLARWEAGAIGRFSGMSVEDESFGGGDWIRGGGFGALSGTLDLGSQDQRFDWFGQLDLMPLNVGRFGYKGSQKRVESTFGWQLSAGAFQATGAPMEFGARFRMFSETMTLSDNSRPQLNQYYLEALARLQL